MIAAGPASRTFRGMVRSNDTAAFIVNQLKKNTTVEKITDAMCVNFDVDRETAKCDVEEVIEKLRGIGAIDE